MSSADADATTTAAPPPQSLIPNLPDDVALNILSRVPRSQLPKLSRVSKPIRTLLTSPLFFATRSLFGTSEPSLYLSLRVSTLPSLRWFTLYPNPNHSSAHFLLPLPPTPTPLVGSAFAAVGHFVYVIGGSLNDVPTSHVWALDCRSRTWEFVPGMRVPREFAAAGVIDGRVYVIGGCLVDTWSRSRYWAEAFDPETRRWEAIESNEGGIFRERWMHASAVLGGRIYAMADRNGVVYDPKSGKWEVVETELDLGWRGRACVVDGILYCYDYLGKIKGFDGETRVWKELRGVEKGLPRFLCGATMANLEGNLVVVWEVTGRGEGKEKGVLEVWCAEIAVEKKGESGELWGKIEWCDVVHRDVLGSSIVHCLAVVL